MALLEGIYAKKHANEAIAFALKLGNEEREAAIQALAVARTLSVMMDTFTEKFNRAYVDHKNMQKDLAKYHDHPGYITQLGEKSDRVDMYESLLYVLKYAGFGDHPIEGIALQELSTEKPTPQRS